MLPLRRWRWPSLLRLILAVLHQVIFHGKEDKNLTSTHTGFRQLLIQFHVSTEVVTLGVSLFVLGFAIGPLLWAPLSELYGRQIVFFITYAALTAFNAGAAGSQNIQTLLILRFLAGAFGSSPLTNSGGVIADMFTSRVRGLGSGVF